MLPEKKEKTMADKLNPYYDPIQYHIGITNSSEKELNYQLAFFDAIYSKMLDKASYFVFSKAHSPDVDGAILEVDSLFQNIKKSDS